MDEKQLLENLKKHIQEVKYYGDQIHEITIKIEDRDPNYVYLMHSTSLSDEDIEDVYKNGLAYSGNDLERTFNYLSHNWTITSWSKEWADRTSMEQVIVEHCKQASAFYCFLYKIPVSFFERNKGDFYPIPIWWLDQDYTYKENPSSSGISYEFGKKDSIYFRIFPSLLFGHYDLKTNQFYKNESYSPIFWNPNGIYDKRQLLLFSKEGLDIWKHNEFVMEGRKSPYSPMIEEVSERYENKFKSGQELR